MKINNSHKIYRMTNLQLVFFEWFLDFLLWRDFSLPTWVHVVRNIPRLIFTPAGVLIDRRKSYRFHWPERRAAEILRWKMRLWFYSEDDSHPTQP